MHDSLPIPVWTLERQSRSVAEIIRSSVTPEHADAPLSLDLLVRAPGVLQTNEDMADAEDFWPAVNKALQSGLRQLVKMREREGAHLLKDLRERIEMMRNSVAEVQQQAPQVQKRYREQLIDRIKNAGVEVESI